jgi:hypothetical protein
MSSTDRATAARAARWTGRSPEQRKAETRPARLALAVKELVDQAPALTEDQKNRLRIILAQAPSGGGQDAA